MKGRLFLGASAVLCLSCGALASCSGDDASQCQGAACADAGADGASDAQSSNDGSSSDAGDAAASPCPGLPAGSLDPTFGTGGLAIASFAAIGAGINGLALQADGKVIAVGAASSTRSDFTVARFLSNGALDTTFGGGDAGSAPGVSTVPFPGTSIATAAAVQPDGKIVVVGYASSNPGTNIYDFAVVRLNTDGRLDSSFGGGKLTFDLGTSGDQAYGVAIDPTGNIFVVGSADNAGAAIVALSSFGALVGTFAGPDGGAGGKVVFSNAGIEGATAVLLDGSGIVVAGKATNGTDDDFFVARLNASGNLDTGFGVNGIVETDFGASDEAVAIAKTAGGGYEVTGSLETGTPTYAYGAFRVSSTGSPDTSFGPSGRATGSFGTDRASYAGIALDAIGRTTIVAALQTRLDGGGADDTFLANRIGNGGTLDTSFGNAGRVITHVGASSAAAALVAQPDGKLVSGGYALLDAGLPANFALVRYCP